MITFIQGWYLIYTRPNREKKVAANLFEQKIDVYLPLIKMIRQWHDRKKYAEVPLFPSYVFVYLREMSHYYTSLNCEGVLYFVKSQKESVRVNSKVIDDIRLIVNSGKNVEVSSDRLEAGQKVLIHEGPFAGLTCEVVEHKRKQKISVYIQCLERNLLAEVPYEFVTTLSD
jgi:transcription antitermination factor NusG